MILLLKTYLTSGHGDNMVNLWGKINWINKHPTETIIAKVDSRCITPSSLDRVIVVTHENFEFVNSGAIDLTKYKAVLLPSVFQVQIKKPSDITPFGILPNDLLHLCEKDVVRVENETSKVSVIFKNDFKHNSILVTERCNNYCVMCSQPPRDIDDSWITDEILRMVPLIDQNCASIGLTGGEPTLLGDKLIDIISLIKNYLPRTSLHVLSNGRLLANQEFAKKIGSVKHQDLMFGIPIYSDNYIDHDYVVQAKGGFNEAIQGILNLKKNGVKTEIRCVLHRDTYTRLPELANFILRNLTFVDHVALMGYEAMGFGKTNSKNLFVLPEVFNEKLVKAVELLKAARLNVSVYNLPYCLTDERIRDSAVQSISDWKNEYLEECAGCKYQSKCCGFFTSTKSLYAGKVIPLKS